MVVIVGFAVVVIVGFAVVVIVGFAVIMIMPMIPVFAAMIVSMPFMVMSVMMAFCVVSLPEQIFHVSVMIVQFSIQHNLKITAFDCLLFHA